MSNTLMEQAVGATTEFWGDAVSSRTHGEYSDGNLCPLCALEIPPRATPIINRAKLCREHRAHVDVKTPLDVQRFLRYAERVAFAKVDAIARDIVPVMARVED